jgi:hypothetical protein
VRALLLRKVLRVDGMIICATAVQQRNSATTKQHHHVEAALMGRNAICKCIVFTQPTQHASGPVCCVASYTYALCDPIESAALQLLQILYCNCSHIK